MNKLSYSGRKDYNFSGDKKLNYSELQESVKRLAGEVDSKKHSFIDSNCEYCCHDGGTKEHNYSE